MASVSVRELRQNLSVHLRRVARGEALEVTSRGVPVAALAPLPDRLTARERLIAAGRLQPGSGNLVALGAPVARPVAVAISSALAEERVERWGVLYLDSSALVKLVVPETETEALLSRLGAGEGLASSVLAAIEVPRAARRASDDPEVHARAGQVVAAIDLLSLGPEVRELAARLAPIALRSLEAVHLASALAVADHVTAFVAYDERLAEAAADAGLDVIAPGARVR